MKRIYIFLGIVAGLGLLLKAAVGPTTTTQNTLEAVQSAHTSITPPHSSDITIIPTVAITIAPTATPIPTKYIAPTAYIAPTKAYVPTTAPINVPAQGLSNDNSYINSQGNEVHSPAYSDSVPAGASAQCSDGTYSFSQSRRGTCSGHGGVSSWL